MAEADTGPALTPADPPAPAPRPEPPAGVQMLDPRVVSLDRLVGAIVGVILSAAYLLAIAVVLITRPWPAVALLLFSLSWFPAAALLAWLAVQWPRIDYRHRRYRLDAEGIEIWSGVIWREAVMVPRSRVQHIDVSQGPLERSHGLATLSIHTAGTHYSKVDLRGLDHRVARTIRDALLPKDDERAV